MEKFQTVFSVPMHCQGCADDITAAIKALSAAIEVSPKVEEDLVSVTGTVAPSAIMDAIQGTGRDAILRGSGGADSAAVCILETHVPNVKDPIRGLARIVQVSAQVVVVDLSVKGMQPGEYEATVRVTGDISRGAASTGAVWGHDALETPEADAKGHFGRLEVGDDGAGSVLLVRRVQIWELVGRSMVLSRADGRSKDGVFDENETVVGVIARSAGVWENNKTVCSCSGKTVWEERAEAVEKGML